ncbi:hypothetical protein DERF_009789 [Dermatophagoides farinae]|uniref:Uncharacterized protein n=1 Tax=Dermatophagoides farinae TaxID=6954 RepID=A0A922HVP2_DERFA|nr:hypothetical protein DERF_009789 [Dermatophagoides farinae]
MYQEKKTFELVGNNQQNNPSSTSKSSYLKAYMLIISNKVNMKKKSLSMPIIFINRNRMAYNPEHIILRMY